MFSTYRNAIRSFSQDVKLVLISSAFINFGYVGIFVMLFNLYLLRLGFGTEFIGLINAVAQLGFALFSLPAGAIGSRWGSRRMAIIGLAVAVFGLFLVPMAEWLPKAWWSAWLMSSYVLAWLGGALFLVNMNPFLMALTKPDERAHVFSVRQAILPLAGFAGNLTGGFLPTAFANWQGLTLDQAGPYRYALFAAALLLMPAVVALIKTQEVEETRPQMETKAMKQAPPVGLISFIALIVLLQVAGYSAANIFFNVYLDQGLQVSTSTIGFLSALGQLIAAPAALLTPLVVMRLGKGKTIIGGFLGLAISLLPLALLPYWGTAGLGFIGVNALFIFTAPVFVICQQELVSPATRATMSGAAAMATGLGTAAMAFGGGYLIVNFGYQTLFLTGAGLVTLSAILFWTFTWAPRWYLTRHIVAKQA